MEREESSVGISDLIASFLQESLEETDGGVLEVQRNDLAQRFNCVPSQINYVMSTRFSPERGYIVESRRGGGGYIRIHRVQYTPGCSPLMHVVNSIGETLVPAAAQAILDSLAGERWISPAAARLIGAALSDQAYRDVPVECRDRLRAKLMKQMLTALNM